MDNRTVLRDVFVGQDKVSHHSFALASRAAASSPSRARPLPFAPGHMMPEIAEDLDRIEPACADLGRYESTSAEAAQAQACGTETTAATNRIATRASLAAAERRSDNRG